MADQSLLDALRQEIDAIDDQLNELFQQRMELVEYVAQYKKEHNISVLDANREQEILARLTQDQTPEQAAHTTALFEHIFKISRSAQQK